MFLGLEPSAKLMLAEERKPGQKMTESGVIIPETVAATHKIFEIRDVGDEVARYKAGDVVLTTVYAGMSFEWQHRQVALLTEEDVMAALVEPE